MISCCSCIPFRYRNLEDDDCGTPEKIVEVLMINSTSGPGLLFPKVRLVDPATCRSLEVNGAFSIHFFIWLRCSSVS